MVYKQKSFHAPRRQDIVELILKYPFANLITHHNGRTEISHLPFIYVEEEGDHGSLYVHLARANPRWLAIDEGAECIVVFNGPQSYISPSWYPPNSEDHIPTWNYAAVHAYGKGERLDDPNKVFWQMDQIHRMHDQGPLTTVSEEEKQSMIPQVVLFRIPIDRWENIFKLTQNRDLADAEGAMGKLAESSNSLKKELSKLMQISIDQRRLQDKQDG
jgi:transcriptional regulator